ncbi:hypothetical protein LTR56_025851 [Elasticomyces elasticus]|nr:hypothetical protein LTR56_025851 [Elasticomyces elasticus]KAK3665375.1 hypothetical protein LTR22_003898 [Elasticomyces elasticus]KAK4929650.1 hypothetical protein LTR49_003607 [Elasticomyces elasticus]KAK5761128.1 hypothetical protein LTS12_008806 [Elasticomyces elasticus]
MACMLALSFACLVVFAVAQNACNSSPYHSVACLEDYEAASTLCASATQPTTTTLTTTAVVWVTEKASFDASSPVTFTDSSTRSETVTITTDLGSTVTSFTTKTDLASTTLTTYTGAASTAWSPTTWSWRRIKRERPAQATCTSAVALSALLTLSSEQLEVACSCLGMPMPIATTTASAVETSTTTFNQGSASTTTLLMLVGITYTKTITLPPSTAWITLSTSATSTATVALAAPTFTKAFGPEAGCIDQAYSGGDQLDPSITDVREAVQKCQDRCAQNPLCQGLYVQQLFTDYGDVKPYWNCNFNSQHLNVSRDLQCGSTIGIWGVAVGFDGNGRGK